MKIEVKQLGIPKVVRVRKGRKFFNMDMLVAPRGFGKGSYGNSFDNKISPSPSTTT